MKLFQKLINLVKKLQSMQTKSVLNGKTINLTSDNTIIKSTNFNVDKNGNMTCKNANVTGTITSNNANITGGKINVKGEGSTKDLLRVTNSSNSSQYSYLQPIGAGFVNGDNRVHIFTEGKNSWGGTVCSIDVRDDGGYTNIDGSGIRTPNVTQTSLESQKKNFEKYTNALETLKDIDIYKYNLKSESDNTKKHIGFVIGDNYKYSEEVTSRENDGADIYSFVSVCCKAIQEQQEEIEELKKEIEKLKGGK